MAKEFLILGCHRTGTTLLRFILEAHPKIYCLGETSAYSAFLHNSKIDTKKPVIGYQLSSMIDHIPLQSKKKYHIISLTRDPIDIVASMKLLEIPRGNMLEHYVTPLVEKRTMSDALFCMTLKDEIEMLTEYEAGTPNYFAACAAIQYKWVLAVMDKYRSLDYPVLQISYESLVQNSEIELKKVCEFLEVAFSPEMLHHNDPEVFHSDVLRSGITLGANDPTVAIKDQSVGRGYTFLTKEQIETIKKFMEIGK